MVGRPVLSPQEVALTRATKNSQNEENIINEDGKKYYQLLLSQRRLLSYPAAVIDFTTVIPEAVFFKVDDKIVIIL